MKERLRAVQPNWKMNSASSKIISKIIPITFRISFIYAVCRTCLQLDFTRLFSFTDVPGGKTSYTMKLYFWFSDCIHNLMI